MAGGGFATSGGGEFEAKITPIVIISCIMAATGGLMFGYDVGVSGYLLSLFIMYVSYFIKDQENFVPQITPDFILNFFNPCDVDNDFVPRKTVQ